MYIYCAFLIFLNQYPERLEQIAFNSLFGFPETKVCWEGLGTRGKGDDRGWDCWMASVTRWMRVWVNSRSQWWTGRPSVLRFMGSQGVGHDWATELNWRYQRTYKDGSRGRIFFNSLLEKEMATHSSVLAWRIPGTGEPGGLPSVGSHTTEVT